MLSKLLSIWFVPNIINLVLSTLRVSCLHWTNELHYEDKILDLDWSSVLIISIVTAGASITQNNVPIYPLWDNKGSAKQKILCLLFSNYFFLHYSVMKLHTKSFFLPIHTYAIKCVEDKHQNLIFDLCVQWLLVKSRSLVRFLLSQTRWSGFWLIPYCNIIIIFNSVMERIY